MSSSAILGGAGFRVRCFWHEIAHPGDRVYAIANFFVLRPVKAKTEGLEYRIIAADGRIFWVRESLGERPTVMGGWTSYGA